VGGRLSAYRHVLDLFVTHHGGDAGRIRAALRAGATSEARHLAHALKGAAATLGAGELAARAHELEAAVREAAGAGVAEECLARLENELQALLAALQAYLAAGSAG
jgi:HPt (histidine-containing phosphotransfer) domain-containing protein